MTTDIGDLINLIEDCSSTITNEKTNGNASVLHFHENITLQPSSSTNKEICLTTDERDGIDLIENYTLKYINKVTDENVPALENIIENESDTNLTDDDMEFKVDIENNKHVIKQK